DPVRELDVGVVARREDPRAGVAPRPVLAAEARAGEPDGRPRGDDHEQPDDVRDRDAPEGARRDGEAAEPRQRGFHHRATVALRDKKRAAAGGAAALQGEERLVDLPDHASLSGGSSLLAARPTTPEADLKWGH